MIFRKLCCCLAFLLPLSVAAAPAKKQITQTNGAETVKEEIPVEKPATDGALSTENTPVKNPSDTIENSDTDKQNENVFNSGQARREAQSFVGTINFSPFDLIVSPKKGVTIGWMRSAESTTELEYMNGSLSVPFIVDDLGEVSDTRLSLIQRSFGLRNSFNIHYGLSYYDLKMHAGSKMLQSLIGAPVIDILRVQALGAVIGIGNRWTFDHDIVLGVDWVSWSQPLYVTKTEKELINSFSTSEAKDSAETAIRIGSYFPRISLLKIQLGMSF